MGSTKLALIFAIAKEGQTYFRSCFATSYTLRQSTTLKQLRHFEYSSSFRCLALNQSAQPLSSIEVWHGRPIIPAFYMFESVISFTQELAGSWTLSRIDTVNFFPWSDNGVTSRCWSGVAWVMIQVSLMKVVAQCSVLRVPTLEKTFQIIGQRRIRMKCKYIASYFHGL